MSAPAPRRTGQSAILQARRVSRRDGRCNFCAVQKSCRPCVACSYRLGGTDGSVERNVLRLAAMVFRLIMPEHAANASKDWQKAREVRLCRLSYLTKPSCGLFELEGGDLTSKKAASVAAPSRTSSDPIPRFPRPPASPPMRLGSSS